MYVDAYRAAVAGRGLDGLVGVAVAASGKAYLVVGSLGLSDTQQASVDVKSGLLHQPDSRSSAALFRRLLLCSSVKAQLIAVTVAHDALLCRVVAASVHGLAGNALGALLRYVRNAHLNRRVGIVPLIARHVKADSLEQLHLAPIVVIPACNDNGLVIVAHTLALLYHHHGGVKHVARKPRRDICALYPQRIGTMAHARGVHSDVMGIGVLYKHVLQSFPCAALVYLYLRLYALVTGVVRETVHRNAHLLTADLQTRVLGVVQRLTALNRNVNGDHLHIPRGGLARCVRGYGLQLRAAGIGGYARKVKLKVEGFQR